MNIQVITSFNQTYYDLIGKDSVDSFLQFWPEDVNLICYTEEMPPIIHNRIQCIDYTAFDADYFQFQESTYNQSTKKFAKKAWSTMHAMDTVTNGWIIWLDADVITQQPLTHNLLGQILFANRSCAYLGVTYHTRKDGSPGKWLVPETGFAAINTQHADFQAFRAEYRRRYIEQDFADLRRAYDNDVFGAALLHSGNNGFDLCRYLKKPYKTPLKHTILGPYLEHWKAKHSKKAYADCQ